MLKQKVDNIDENNVVEKIVMGLMGQHKNTYDKIIVFLDEEQKLELCQLLAKLYRKGALDQVWGDEEEKENA